MKKILLVILFLQIYSVKIKKIQEMRVLSFGYAYDLTNRIKPPFPRKGEAFTISNPGLPKIDQKKTRATTNAGNWQLIPQGIYTIDREDFRGNKILLKVMTHTAYKYGMKEIKLNIYELKKDDTHICYGPIIYLDDSSVVYYGDIAEPYIPYFLSNQPISGDITKTSTEDITTGIKGLEKSSDELETTSDIKTENKELEKSGGECDDLVNELEKRLTILSNLVMKK